MRCAGKLCSSFAFVLLIPSISQATPITYTGTATQGNAGLGINVGDSFIATFDFDLSSPVINPTTNPNLAAYQVGGSATVGVGSFTGTGPITLISIANNVGIPPFDAWAAVANVLLSPNINLALSFNDPSASIINGTALFVPGSLVGYGITSWRLSERVINPTGGTSRVVVSGGGIDTISVPEPATLSLLGIGLAGMAFSRRKRKRAI